MRGLRVAIEPYIMILYATPMVALIPFILSLMGFGFGPKVLVVFLFAVFPILYNTVEGARSIKPELIEVARSFRSGEWALWREVMLPYTLPFTMTGVRQAIGRGLVGMVAAEFFLSSTGLGQIIMMASQNFDTAGVFAMILVIGLIGVGLMRVGPMIENHFARWRNDHGRSRAPARHAHARARRTLARWRRGSRPGSSILLLWEVVVRAFAPPFVAKPSGIVAGDPAK